MSGDMEQYPEQKKQIPVEVKVLRIIYMYQNIKRKITTRQIDSSFENSLNFTIIFLHINFTINPLFHNNYGKMMSY